MAEKVFAALYGIMSWLTWISVIAMLIFVAVMFITGADRTPQIELNSLTVSEVPGDDAALALHGNGGEAGWYRADYALSFAGARLSPYTYAANGVKLQNGTEPGTPFFITTDKPIEYSKLSPCSVTVSLYIKSPSGEEASRVADNAVFSLTGVQVGFSLFGGRLTNGTPSFSATSSS